MLIHTKERQCTLTNEAEEDSGNQSEGLWLGTLLGSYVTSLGKKINRQQPELSVNLNTELTSLWALLRGITKMGHFCPFV